MLTVSKAKDSKVKRQVSAEVEIDGKSGDGALKCRNNLVMTESCQDFIDS